MTIDDLVDKVLARHKNEDNTLKDTTQEPFRYLITEEEIRQELQSQKPSQVSVMSLAKDKNLFDFNQGLFKLALGDTNTIESVLKKHRDIRKNRPE
jgi:hypothetical protein